MARARGRGRGADAARLRGRVPGRPRGARGGRVRQRHRARGGIVRRALEGALRGRLASGFPGAGTARRAVARALGERGRELGLVVERRRVVESATFSFRAEAFSRDVAAQIRDALLATLPAGVWVEQRSEKEETHPEAHGPEPFAPLHEYIYRVSGDIVGPFEGVLEVWQRARTLEFVETGSLHLDGKIISV